MFNGDTNTSHSGNPSTGSSGTSATAVRLAEKPVVVDAMGGDLGLAVQVEGALAAYREFGAHSILVGPENELRQKLTALGGQDAPIRIHHASEVITMNDSPAKAVRRKPDASLNVAYQLLESGEGSAVLSAGNSGAMMAAGRMICGLLPGIERPAIATLVPVLKNAQPNVLLDVGANVDCHAQNLVQFALMGAIYHAALFGGESPRVALLSNGSEPSKGTDRVRTAAAILSQLPRCNYVGYVEGRDVTTEAADVIVCDGFVGNVLLKAMEGCVRFLFDHIVEEGKKSLTGKLGLFLSRGVYKRLFKEKFDYTAHGGAPLLGLRKLAVVLHGSSDARAVKNAVRLAHGFAASQMTEKIQAAIAQLEENFQEIDEDVLSGVIVRNRSEKSGAETNHRSVVAKDEPIGEAEDGENPAQ